MDRRREALSQLQPYVTQAQSFSGSVYPVEVRPIEAGPPWDYEAIARNRVRQARVVLDLGTGGGEVLSRIVDGQAAHVVATEEWKVNAPVARRRLAPLGAHVVQASSLRLPFLDGTFDLVLDRHEELDPIEVVRVLTPTGRVVTQQCGPDDWAELWQFFPCEHSYGDHFEAYVSGFRAAGLSVSGVKHYRKVAFRSLGDLVYMILVTPGLIPGFDPARDIDTLLALEDGCHTQDGIILTESRYLIRAEASG